MKLSEITTDEPDILISDDMSADDREDLAEAINERIRQLRALSAVSRCADFQAHDESIINDYLWMMDRVIREVNTLFKHQTALSMREENE